jgi:hypothetical protein
MTEEEIDEAAARVRKVLENLMASAEFEVRADLACAEIQAGGLRTTSELAAALGLPEQFLAVALQKYGEKIFPHNGGMQ